MLYPIFESQILPKMGVQIKLQHEKLQIFRYEQHWECYHLAHEDDDPFISAPEFELIEHRPETYLRSQQWVSGEQESTFRCFARMPAQTFIAFPAEPILVPRDRKPKLYAHIPLQLSVLIGGSKVPLWEGFFEPVKRTWFGKNNRVGELAITLPQTLSVESQHVETTAHCSKFRACMELRIVNRDAEPLHIERLALPVPFFPVYLLDQSHYWTFPLALTKERLLDELKVNHGKEITQKHELKRFVGEPHQHLEVRTIMRALEAIIG